MAALARLMPRRDHAPSTAPTGWRRYLYHNHKDIDECYLVFGSSPASLA